MRSAVCFSAALTLLCVACDSPTPPHRGGPIVTEGALADVAYEPARRLVSRYCADCHTRGGNNREQPDAWKYALRLDTYADWEKGSRVLKVRLDSAASAAEDPPADVMPRESFPYQPTQAERDTLLDWLARGSPNTVTGLGLDQGP